MCQKYLEVFSNILDENSVNNLAKKHREGFILNNFIKDLLKTLSGLVLAAQSSTEDHLDLESDNGFVNSFVDHIPQLFPCKIFLKAFQECFGELVNQNNHIEQVLSLCKIVYEVIKTCSTHWLLFQVKEDDHFEVSANARVETSDFLCFLLRHVDLMPSTATDLQNQTKSSLTPGVLVLCQLVLRKIHENKEEIPEHILRRVKVGILKDVTCKAVMVAIQHTGTSSWTSDILQKTASGFLEVVTLLCGCDKIETLLSGSSKENGGEEGVVFPCGLLGRVLADIKHFTMKDQLADLPVVVHVFVWCVGRVKHPSLGQHVAMILPPLLHLVDDFRVENRVTGIKVMGHLIDNTNATELCWYGRADVIYEALHHRILSNNSEVMRALLPCLLRILKVVEQPPTKPDVGRRMNRCDQNFQTILTAMEFESKILLRRAYCCHLSKFVDYMGITVLRHTEQLFRVIFRYMEVCDGEREVWRLSTLDTLRTVITVGWPRIPLHANEILKSLGKVLVDISISDIILRQIKQSMFEKIKECLLMLLYCCGQPVEKQLQEMMSGLAQLPEIEQFISDILHCYKSHCNEPY